ncbi:MAG: phospholipase D-like domain-containing protein [Methanomassiliicoccales archaeon]|nr:phospholipase D-like domain-containing protein [Methanomassiliicoccales archaeon]
MNLNLEPINPTGWKVHQSDHSTHTEDGKVRAYFKNLAGSLILEMESADVVVGCVAWLTHPDILEALSRKRFVSIIVQKEDWLRPDYSPENEWRARQRARYETLQGPCRAELGGLLAEMDLTSSMEAFDAVRCVGYRNRSQRDSIPRSHHKFVVMCNKLEHGVRPFRVWTGSFNFTNNAQRSFENAVAIDDEKLSAAYFAEYQQVAALSEPLDWTSEWVEPEWRIGS